MPPSQSIIGHILQTIHAGLRRVLGWASPSRPLGGRIEFTERPATSDNLVIGIIDDPELSMRLMSLRGLISASTISPLATAFAEVRDGAILHVDVTDAVFTDSLALAEVERLIDDLEDRRVRLRMVGLRPSMSGPVD